MSISLQSRARHYIGRHLQSSGPLFQVLSHLLADILDEEIYHQSKSSDCESPIKVSRPYHKRKTRAVSQYVEFCHLMKQKHPLMKNLQSLWKQMKQTDWKSKYASETSTIHSHSHESSSSTSNQDSDSEDSDINNNKHKGGDGSELNPQVPERETVDISESDSESSDCESQSDRSRHDESQSGSDSD
jgi:hypothetical protein